LTQLVVGELWDLVESELGNPLDLFDKSAHLPGQ
jgi:hypothetical protein